MLPCGSEFQVSLYYQITYPSHNHSRITADQLASPERRAPI